VKPILPRGKDGRFDAFMNVLLNIDELVSPDHPFPSPTKMLKIYAALYIAWPAIPHKGLVHVRIADERRKRAAARGDPKRKRGRPADTKSAGAVFRVSLSIRGLPKYMHVCCFTGQKVWPVLGPVVLPTRQLPDQLAYMSLQGTPRYKRPRVTQFTPVQESGMAARFDAAERARLERRAPALERKVVAQAECIAAQSQQLSAKDRQLTDLARQLAEMKAAAGQTDEQKNKDFVTSLLEFRRKHTARRLRGAPYTRWEIDTHVLISRWCRKKEEPAIKVPMLQLFKQVVAAGGLDALGRDKGLWNAVLEACVRDPLRVPAPEPLFRVWNGSHENTTYAECPYATAARVRFTAWNPCCGYRLGARSKNLFSS
jgi:hypothetical protein